MERSPLCPRSYPGAGRIGGDESALCPVLGRSLTERVIPEGEELNVPLEGRTGGWSRRKKLKRNKARREVVLASGFGFIE